MTCRFAYAIVRQHDGDSDPDPDAEAAADHLIPATPGGSKNLRTPDGPGSSEYRLQAEIF
jgi:hypothetical protein